MLDAQEFVLSGPASDGGLKQAFVRYRPLRPRSLPVDRRTRVLSLICLHAIASHKECFLPTIEHIFSLQDADQSNTSRAFVIAEAWSMDSPNHGRAAVLNDGHLGALAGSITGALWARALQALFSSGLVQAGTSLVAVGHSAGAAIIVQATIPHPLHTLPFSSLILIEPTMMSPSILAHALENKHDQALFRAVNAARVRKDIWPSRKDAREFFARRIPWKRWDPRALDLFVEYGLADLPTGVYPSLHSGVTLACSRAHEVPAYSMHGDSEQALNRLVEICPIVPCHVVFGARPDMVTDEVRRSVTSEEEGRKMRSITWIPDAGHLVVQEDPRGTAQVVWKIICGDYGQDRTGQGKGKL